MPTFTNQTDGDLDIPLLGLYIPAGSAFDVDDADADGFRSQPAFTETPTPKLAVTPPTVKPVVDATPAVAEQGE